MKSSRIESLDWLRATALLMVLSCHWGQSIGWSRFGILGGVANCIFFLLSGLGLGITWRDKGCGKLRMEFFKRRLVRLYGAFFVFLVPYVVLLLTTDFSDLHKILLNFLMLSWFAKLPGAGHLWFVTGIAICYVVMAALPIVDGYAQKRPWTTALAGLITCALGQFFLCLIGITQGYFLMMVLLFAGAFIYGPQLMLFAQNNRPIAFFAVVPLAAVAFLVLWLDNSIDCGGNIYYWMCCCIAVAFTLVFVAFNVRLSIPLLSMISGISYEVYLCHYPLCTQSPLSLVWMKSVNMMVYSVTYLGMAFALGWVIHTSTTQLKKIGRRVPSAR